MPTTTARPRRVRRVVAALTVGTLAVGSLAVGTTLPAAALDRLSGHHLAALDAGALATDGGTAPSVVPGSTDGGDRPSWSPDGATVPFAASPFSTQDPTSTTTTNTSDATTDQSQGLAMISTEIEYGSGEAAGTGMVLTADGHVVTNHHVVEGATRIEVTIPQTGATYEATYVGGDAQRDVAVLHLEGASDLTPVAIDTDGLATGDEVVSVGDAGGDGGSFTAAPGTVTQTDTDITVTNDDGSQTRLTDLVEVTSDIVAGDSGGALLDRDGEVVGMNVAATSGGGDIDGYVIPIARVMSTVDRILTGNETGGIVLGTGGFLGVTLSGDTTPVVTGVVADSAAERAGISAGDTITSVDGTAVNSTTALQQAIAAHESGDVVTLEWSDGAGRAQSAEVALGSAPVS